MHGKGGMAILLSKGPPAVSEGPKEGDEEEGEDVADSVEFSEMFDAWTEAMGIKPGDVDASRRRLCALFGIYCAGKEY